MKTINYIIAIIVVSVVLYLAFAFVLWDIAWVKSSSFYVRLIFAILNAACVSTVTEKK